VRLNANEYLFRKRLSLSSFTYTPAVCSPVSQKQLVCASAARVDHNSAWIIDHVDPLVRFEMQGEIVKSNEPILLRHVQTGVYMGTDVNSKYKNDFGTENEVYCFNHSTKNKS